MSADINSVADMQHYIVDTVKWALNSTYHTILQACPGQLPFGRDMIMPMSYIANCHLIQLHGQKQTDKNTVWENDSCITH
jgi:hypothetical protein